MADILSSKDVTDDLVTSLSGLATNLSSQSYEAIQLYVNLPILDPNVQDMLQVAEASNMLDQDAIGTADAIGSSVGDEGYNLLVFPDSTNAADALFDGLWERIKKLFGGLKKKVRRIFCRVVAALGGIDGLDIKVIIRDVLVALIPALAATTGLIPVALPIVVSLAAIYLTYGIQKVCPL